MIKVSPLFSGSKGNCTLIQTHEANILLDAGYNYKQIGERLTQAGLSARDITHIVITHEHSDHISALSQLARNSNAKVYAPKIICDYICEKTFCSSVNEIDGAFNIADLTVDTYQCFHDSRDCLGYRFSDGKASFASVTDTGITDDLLIKFLTPCSTIQLESNHDVDMLKNGRYSYSLKRRILSNRGHLSNLQAAQVLSKLVKSKVKNIILAHLSEENNTKEIAFNTAVQMLNGMGIIEGKDVSVYVADQHINTRTIIC